MTDFGTAEYDGVTGTVTSIELREGSIQLTIQVPMPHPPFDAHRFRLLGVDGTLILTKGEDDPPLWQPARDTGGSTWLYQAIAIASPGILTNAVGPYRR